jgi:hypothetical protein
MTDDEIEIQRAQLKEDLRLAREAYEPLINSEPLPPDHTPAGPGPAAHQLAYENLKAAEMALHDFERDHPPTS